MPKTRSQSKAKRSVRRRTESLSHISLKSPVFIRKPSPNSTEQSTMFASFRTTEYDADDKYHKIAGVNASSSSNITHAEVITSTSSPSTTTTKTDTCERRRSSLLVKFLAVLLASIALLAVLRLQSHQSRYVENDKTTSHQHGFGHTLATEGVASWGDIEVVASHAYLTSFSTGLGVIPFLFTTSPKPWVLGVSNALAAGMMLSASTRLAIEGAHDATMTVDLLSSSHQGGEGIGIEGDGGGGGGEGIPVVVVVEDDTTLSASEQMSLSKSQRNSPVLGNFNTTSQSTFQSSLVPSSSSSGLPQVLLGIALGACVIYVSKTFLDGLEDLRFAGFRGLGAKKALLILGVMTLHSATEGIGIGVSFGTTTTTTTTTTHTITTMASTEQSTQQQQQLHHHHDTDAFGEFISATMAVHNVPEGLATALVLLPRGTSLTETFCWAIFTSLPQPLMAVPAFISVTHFASLLPIGLGFAAGAMTYVAVFELIPEAAIELKSKRLAGIVTLVAAGIMWGVQTMLE